jgi:Predicted O-methyltransferase
MAFVERYVPQGPNSLLSDAPGWSSSSLEEVASSGPVCWKCKGKGNVAEKITNKRRKLQQGGQVTSDTIMPIARVKMKSCTVCHGMGFLSPKKKEMSSIASLPGMITMRRRYPTDVGWETIGPQAHAIWLMKCRGYDKAGLKEQAERTCGEEKQAEDQHPLALLHKANTMEMVEAGVVVPPIEHPEYPWFPFNKGEQLCNLVGDWRILQRVGSHRWTTDDIVTAFVAIQEISKRINSDSKGRQLKYLDLGCGNGSVLQMTSWGLIDKYDLQAFGIEARLEAVMLARRSLSFNIGKDRVGDTISVMHGDFRDLEEFMPSDCGRGKVSHNDLGQVQEFNRVKKEEKFDLVTGTPPYFQVDFTTEGDAQQKKVVTSAVINQGGMPTSIQSAPGEKKLTCSL